MRVTDEMLMSTAREYGVVPGSLKCHVFALLDQGASRSEIRYLLRRYRDPQRPRALAETIRRYEKLWREAKEAYRA